MTQCGVANDNVSTAPTGDSSRRSPEKPLIHSQSFKREIPVNFPIQSSSSWKPEDQADWVYGVREKYPVRSGLGVVFQGLLSSKDPNGLPDLIRKRHLVEVKTAM